MSINNMENNLVIKNRYRPEIDGLRAFSVVAVIINHFNKEILPNGYLGVDIFFLISGFVITSSLYQRRSKNFNDFISGFYVRRIKRLVPALSVFVLIMSVAICLFDPNPRLSLRTGLTSLFGLSNLYLLRQSTDYFSQSTEFNVFTHTWSLGVEEQFYILFPFLIWLSGFGRQTKNGNRNLLLIIGVLAIVSLIGFLYLYPLNQSAAYFLMPTRFWEMASGCLLFVGFQKRKSINQLLEKVSPIVVLAIIVGIMYLPMSMATISTLSVVTLSGVLIATLRKQTFAYKIFTHPKVVYIGLISYSLYLWHWGILSISRWTIGIHWWSVPFQVILMLSLAICSYRYIETPLRNGNWFGKRWKTIVVGGGVLVIFSGSLIALDKPLKGKLFTGKKTMDSTKKHWSTQIRLGNSSLTAIKCFAYPTYPQKQLKALFNECKYPLIRKSNNQKTLAFVGDSHTMAMLDATETLTNSGFRVIHYSYAGCPFPIPPHGIYPNECNKFLINAENKIFQDLKSGDSIIINNYHLSHLGGNNLKDIRHHIFDKNKKLVSDSPTKINLYMKGLENLSTKASKKSISIYLIGSPYRNKALELTKEWFRPYDLALKNLLEEEGNARKLNKELLQYIKNRSLKNIIFLDPLEILDKSCGKNVKTFLQCFRDGDHLSEKSSKELLDFLMRNYLKPHNDQNIL